MTQNGRRSDSFWKRHRRGLAATLGAAIATGFVYYVLPEIVGLGPTLRRLRAGDGWWLAVGVLLEAGSYFGDIVFFRGVFSARSHRIGWRESTQISLAGTAATKFFATAGAGGIALTIWSLRAFGLSAPDVATGMVTYEIITYGVYMAALAIAGFGLWIGVFAGRAPIGLTLIPASFAVAVILIVLSMLFWDQPAERFLLRQAARLKQKRASRWFRRLAAMPRSLHSGLLGALAMVKRRDRSILGAIANWGFDIGTLWASFHAFGQPPPPAVLVTGYYVGTLANALPLPGGIGGVEGGMIGAFIGFGVNGRLAVLAVLGYRTISYWLPTVPGAIAYVRLRHSIQASHPAESVAADA